MQWFGDRVRILRDKHKWSQEELAEYAHITSKYLSDIETGKRLPTQLTVGTVENLASALEIPPRDLLYPTSPREEV